MSLPQAQKSAVISSHRRDDKDTGSPEVQIAIFSERISYLTGHFKTHAKDHASRRGLIALVSKRRSLLDYLRRREPERYKAIVDKLGLRR